MTLERAHREYSASQAERNFLCPGSTNLLRRVPARPSGPHAVEGTKAHAVVELALERGILDAREAHMAHPELKVESLDDGKNEFYVAVQMMLDHVAALRQAHPDAEMWTEAFVNPPVESKPGSAGGYCDVAIYSRAAATLFVIDYKHGAGVVKDADGPQLKQYAAGFLYEDDAKVDVNTVDTVVLTVVQPRAFHKDGPIREHDMTPFEVWEYLNDLDALIAQAEKPDAPLNPGTVQCRFCDAAPLCPAREAAAVQVAGKAFTQIREVVATDLPHPAVMDIERLAYIRANAPMMRKWLDDVDKYIESIMRAGADVPGAKLVETQARREWYGEEAERARRLAALMGSNDPEVAYRKMFLPITTAEKLVVEAYKRTVGRGKKQAAAADARKAMAYLTLKTTSGNLKVVDIDDPAPAVNHVKNAFGQIAGALPPVPKPGEET